MRNLKPEWSDLEEGEREIIQEIVEESGILNETGPVDTMRLAEHFYTMARDNIDEFFDDE